MTSTISNGLIKAVIHHKGAELQSLTYGDSEYLWEGDPHWWGKHAPILFPVVGSLKEGKFNHGGSEYKLNRHGFARDMVFDVVDQSSEQIVFELRSGSETLNFYPFQFSLQVSYKTQNNNLITTYQVVNSGSEQMYFSIGAHPAFALKDRFENYSLQFDPAVDLRFNLLQEGLLSNESAPLKTTSGLLPLHQNLFDNDALVFRQSTIRGVTINHLGKPRLTVEFPEFPDLGVWTVSGAAFICIEPWFGYSDTVDFKGDLSDKAGIIALGTGQIFRSTFTITIH
jgi:galactose mutarotase-like enzyme